MIYKLVNKLAYQFSDEVWDLSPRMNDIREQELGIFKKNLKKHKLVPYGMWLERIVPVSYEDCEKETLVFMGHMLEKQGAQLVIQTLPFLAEKYPRIRLKLIGGGSYLSVLQKLAADLGVSDRCIFMGKIPDIRDVEKEIARSCIAYAPYISSLDMWTKYADPGKVKTYLACGVPVILTDVPWNAKEICIKKCGMLVKEDLDDLIVKTMTLLDPKINTSYRINALNFAQSFSWNTLLGQTLHI
jgi:glycosyltransferase involved in cell wall biosynthesis